MAVDSTGAAYVAGYTASYDLPTANPKQNFNAGSNDVFVAKLNPGGNCAGLLHLPGRFGRRPGIRNCGGRQRGGRSSRLHHFSQFSGNHRRPAGQNWRARRMPLS